MRKQLNAPVPGITRRTLAYEKDDGGRSKYYKGSKAGDCVIRAIAIATDQDYKVVYYELTSIAMPMGLYANDDKVWKKYLKSLGWTEHKFGRDAKDLIDTKLPHYRCIAVTNSHLSAVIGNTIYDTWNPSDRKCWRYWYDK